jgi:hypothetical protein
VWWERVMGRRVVGMACGRKTNLETASPGCWLTATARRSIGRPTVVWSRRYAHHPCSVKTERDVLLAGADDPYAHHPCSVKTPIDSLVPAGLIEDIARKCGAVQRHRRIDITMLVWSLILDFAVDSEARSIAACQPSYQTATNQKAARSIGDSEPVYTSDRTTACDRSCSGFQTLL